MPGFSGSPVPKMRTTADSSQAEEASQEGYCSASSAHGTARTEAQRLGLLACLATSIFYCIFGSFCGVPLSALLRKWERLQTALSQKGLALKAVAQPHLPMALLAQSHRYWGCLLVLPHQTSNVTCGCPRRDPASALLQNCKGLQIAIRQKELAWKAVAQPHLPMALLAQRHGEWGC